MKLGKITVWSIFLCWEGSVKKVRAIMALLVTAGLLLFPSASARAGQADGPLRKLVDAARVDGQMDLMVTSSQGQKGAQELADAFKRRFGLSISAPSEAWRFLQGESPC